MHILILHGWGQSGSDWESLATKLENKNINTSVIDMPGFGNRKRIKDNWGVPQYADWVIKYITKNNLNNNLIILGHSFGGRVAAEIASKNPKYLKALILSGAPCIYRPTSIIIIKIKIYKLFKFMMPKFIKNLFYPSDLKKASQNNLGKVFRKVVNFDQTKQLQSIEVPTLLIWGEEDKYPSLKIAKEINNLIKNSELEIIEDATHNSYFENPNLFFGLTTSFINKL